MSEKVRYVHITIHDIPAELLMEFCKKVVEPNYPGGISPAIKDLMRKAVEEQKQQEVFEKFPWRKDTELFNEAGHLATSKRRYENYSIFGLGEIVACLHGIEAVFRPPTEYPDAILVNLENEETINVEFEEFSSDFKRHGHDPSKCDLIICNVHDWREKYPEDCPLSVYELSGEEFFAYEHALIGKFYRKEERKVKRE